MDLHCFINASHCICLCLGEARKNICPISYSIALAYESHVNTTSEACQGWQAASLLPHSKTVVLNLWPMRPCHPACGLSSTGLKIWQLPLLPNHQTHEELQGSMKQGTTTCVPNVFGKMWEVILSACLSTLEFASP